MTGNRGFTLVELLLVLGVAAIISGVLYKFFPAIVKGSISQDQVVEMQQQLRAGLTVMAKEIRMAGYDPNRACSNPLLIAENNRISFTLDSERDGDCTDDPNDVITYFVSTCKSDCSGTCQPCLRRSSKSSTQSIAENIQAIGFAYAFDDDDDGQLDKDPLQNGIIWAVDSDCDGDLDKNLDTNHDGEVDNNDNASGENLAEEISFDKIRAVKIWLLARSEREDRESHSATTYTLADQRITVNDGYRRRLLTSTLYLRNMGL